jgi:hypothetical protein
MISEIHGVHWSIWIKWVFCLTKASSVGWRAKGINSSVGFPSSLGREERFRTVHAKDIREYEITSEGVVILGGRLTNYQRLITGIPEWLKPSDQKEKPSRRRETKR